VSLHFQVRTGQRHCPRITSRWYNTRWFNPQPSCRGGTPQTWVSLLGLPRSPSSLFLPYHPNTLPVARAHPLLPRTTRRAAASHCSPPPGVSDSKPDSEGGSAAVAGVGVGEGVGCDELADDRVDGVAEGEGEGAGEERRVDGEVVLPALQLHVGHLLHLRGRACVWRACELVLTSFTSRGVRARGYFSEQGLVRVSRCLFVTYSMSENARVCESVRT
jgi:hypothetical protein